MLSTILHKPNLKAKLSAKNFVLLCDNQNLLVGCSNQELKPDFQLSEINKNKGNYFGLIAYDYKNEIEKLSSGNMANYTVPNLCFFKDDSYLKLDQQFNSDLKNMVLKEMKFENIHDFKTDFKVEARTKKEVYKEKYAKIANYIQQGHIYEMNYCVEFFAEQVYINPYIVFSILNKIASAPFSAFCCFDGIYVMCSSPERFIKRESNKLITQPIKGTAKRDSDKTIDEKIKSELRSSIKEQTENVMIVDVARNDLSRFAERGSVKVDELFGIKSYPQVHQMVSTISCAVPGDTSLKDIIHATFPMASMTGAPKISAMQIIDELEDFKRSIYSGAIGYVKPNGDFDFNVVIRSIVYDSNTGYLSFSVGGAITALSNWEDEYNECLLKAQGMLKALEC